MVKNNPITKPMIKDEKAETLWEIFEKTGSIGAYILYCEHMDRTYLPVTDDEKPPSR